jgi:hypothetical protein
LPGLVTTVEQRLNLVASHGSGVSGNALSIRSRGVVLKAHGPGQTARAQALFDGNPDTARVALVLPLLHTGDTLEA